MSASRWGRFSVAGDSGRRAVRAVLVVLTLAALATGCTRGIKGIYGVSFRQQPGGERLTEKVRTVIGIPMKPPEGMSQDLANAFVNGALQGLPVDFVVSPDELGDDASAYGKVLSQIVRDERLPGPYALLLSQVSVSHYSGDVRYAATRVVFRLGLLPDDASIIEFGATMNLAKQQPSNALGATQAFVTRYAAKLRKFLRRTEPRSALETLSVFEIGADDKPLFRHAELTASALGTEVPVLCPNDTVLSVDGVRVKNRFHFRRLVSRLAGSPVRQTTVRAWRGTDDKDAVGIGATVLWRGGSVRLCPVPGGQAEAAGIRRDDRLMFVDGVRVNSTSLGDTTKWLNPAGRKGFRLGIERPGAGRMELDVGVGSVMGGVVELVLNRETGARAALGLVLSMDKDRIVLEPAAGGAAEGAGVQKGDILVEVDGVPLIGASLVSAVRFLAGPPGKPVTLTIKRGEAEPVDLVVVRPDAALLPPMDGFEHEAYLYEDLRYFRSALEPSPVEGKEAAPATAP